MTIVGRILLSFALVIAIFLTQSLATVWKIDGLADRIQSEAEGPIVLVDSAHSVWDAFRSASEDLGRFVEGTQIRASSDALPEFQAKLARAESQLERLMAYSNDRKTSELAKSASAAIGHWTNAAMVFMGGIPAARIPSPHTMRQQEMEVRRILHDLVHVSLANANEMRQQMIDSAIGARNWAVLLTGIGTLIGIALALVAATSITRPLGRIVKAMNLLAAGKTDFVTPDTTRHDEIGEVARMLEQYRNTAVEREQLKEQQDSARQKEISRQKQLEKLVAGFRQAMAGITATLDREQRNMSAAAETLSNVAVDATSRAEQAAGASSGVAENTQCVAAATEQLDASIREISEQAKQARQVGDEAARTVDATNADVEGLTVASRQIEQIIAMISDIADQTNLLALNSTIEAARAGEAGRGFAVVASEVKSLADRSAKAAAEVSKLIASMQGSTHAAVGAMAMITEKIDRMAALNGAIAESVSQQHAATQEISAGIHKAADSSRNAVSSAEDVKAAARDTKSQSEKVGITSQSLAEVTTELSKQVDDFLELVSADLEERRQSVRREIREIVDIDVNGRTFRARVENASVGGLKFTCDAPLQEGQRIRVKLPEGFVAARVRWSEGDEFGVAFDAQLNRFPFDKSDNSKFGIAA